MRRSKFRTACGVVAGIGFFIMLVAAGGSDTGTLDRPESFCLAAYLPPDAIWEGISNEQG